MLVNSKNLALNAELERKKDVETQLEDADQLLGEAHKQIEEGYFQINEAQKRLESAHRDINVLEDEKRDLGSKLEGLLQNCFQKSWRQVEELERIEQVVNDLVHQVNHEVSAIQSRQEFVRQLAAPLYDCLVKQVLEEQHEGLIEAYVADLKDLQAQAQELGAQRVAMQADFDRQMPYIVQYQKQERNGQSGDYLNDAELMSQSYQSFLDKEFSLTEAQLQKVQTPAEIVGLVSFVIDYKLPVLQLQTELSKLERTKFAIVRKYAELEKSIDNLQRVRYRPYKFDDVDKYVAAYFNASGADLGIERIDAGIYQI